MADDELALARRVVAAPGWRWLAGMRVWSTPPWRLSARAARDLSADDGHRHMIPDIDEYATRLALAAVARLAWGIPTMSAVWNAINGGQWEVWRWDTVVLITQGPTEASAWVEAICTAPVKP